MVLGFEIKIKEQKKRYNTNSSGIVGIRSGNLNQS